MMSFYVHILFKSTLESSFRFHEYLFLWSIDVYIPRANGCILNLRAIMCEEREINCRGVFYCCSRWMWFFYLLFLSIIPHIWIVQTPLNHYSISSYKQSKIFYSASSCQIQSIIIFSDMPSSDCMTITWK
jgi:hypothetical protein